MKRRCSFRKCRTILNQYNGDPCCGSHQVAYVELMNQRIQDCETYISSLKNYIRMASKVKEMKAKIVSEQEKIKKIAKARDRKFPCVEIESKSGESIYAEKADIPVGF